MSAHHHHVFHLDLYHDHHPRAFHHFFNRPCHYDDELDIDDVATTAHHDTTLNDHFNLVASTKRHHGVDVSTDGDRDDTPSGGSVPPV